MSRPRRRTGAPTARAHRAARRTGGVFYTDNELDEEFIDNLRKIVEGKLRSTPASAREVAAYLAAIKVSTVPLTTSDVRQVFDTLVYDGKIEPLQAPGAVIDDPGDVQYRLTQCVLLASRGSAPTAPQLTLARPSLVCVSPIEARNHLTAVPCGACPVRSECTPGGAVSPETCHYLAKWLDF